MRIKFTNKNFEYFSEYTITLSYNTIASTFSFNALSSILGMPLVYSFVELYDDNNELLITGYILSSAYKVSASPEQEVYPGYSITGVLEDCSIPYPFQFDNLSLREITTKLLAPYGLSFVVDPSVNKDMDKVYKISSPSDSASVKDYISAMASQRGIILTHDNKGRLVFTKIDPSKLSPVASFIDGNGGFTEMSLTANGQKMHSSITVVRQASVDNSDAGESTINNPYVTNRHRPLTKILTNGDIFDLKTAARNELSRELMDITLTIETTLFVKPGNLIEVLAPSLKIRKKTNWFVTQTTIKGTTEGVTYSLQCVLPDVFTTNPVKNIFL